MKTHTNHTAVNHNHFHADDPAKQSEHSAVHNLITTKNATHTAVKNGSWFDTSTWKGGRIPGNNARVVIPKGIDVTYDDTSNARLFGLRVDGQLDFATNADTKMIIDTFIVSSDGTLTIGTEKNPVQSNVKTEILIAGKGAIDTKWDPQQLSRGIVSHGVVSIHGEAKTSHLKVAVDPAAGDKTLVLESAPSNWRVGDRIVLTGTQYVANGTQDEERTITSIKGSRITLNKALTYDHDTPSSELKAYVANQSRNVVIATENADGLPANQRGHIMFMHSDNVDVRYAEFNDLGRTDKSKLIDDFQIRNDAKGSRALDKNGDPIVGKRTNIRGRYALHLHRTGVNGDDSPAVLVGNSVAGSPGWGIVQHDSYAVLENNLSYDVFGAGFVSETGNEIGAWKNNISIKNQGRKGNEKHGEGNHDFGFAGHGFWFQSRSIENEGNVAAGNRGSGIFYFHRGADQIEIEAENLAIEAWAKGQTTVNSDEAPITGFKNNEVFASDNGLKVIKNFQRQWHDGRSVLDGFTAWEVGQGTELQYTSHYTLKDFKLIGSDYVAKSWLNDGVHLAQNTEDIVFDGLDVKGFDRGVNLQKKSTGVPDINDRGYIFVDAKVSDNKQDWINLDRKVDRLIGRKDIKQKQLSFSLDQAKSDLVVSKNDGRQHISIVGTKTDSLGTVELPFGNDFLSFVSGGTRNLAKDGYYTLPNGQRAVVIDEYISDRLTGDVRRYSFVVTFENNWRTDGSRNLGPLDPNKIKKSSGIIPFESLAFNYADQVKSGGGKHHTSDNHNTDSHHSDEHSMGGHGENSGSAGGSDNSDQPTNGQSSDHSMDNSGSGNHESTEDNHGSQNSTDSHGTDNHSTDGHSGNQSMNTDGSSGSEISGTKGKDTINGTAGNDSINAEGGSDTVSGGAGNDVIDGSWGWDKIDGGAGNDTINGGPGKDTLTGGDGSDVFVFGKDNKSKTDVITDFETGADRLDIREIASFSALDANGDSIVDSQFVTQTNKGIQFDLSSFGGGRIELTGVDSLSAGDFLQKEGNSTTETTTDSGSTHNAETEATENTDATDTGSSSAGNSANSIDNTETVDEVAEPPKTDNSPTAGDIFSGTKKKDIINGTTGNDTIDAGGGSDTVAGNSGDDLISGGWGWDKIDGGDGNDTISGGPGKNTLTGGHGNDVFVIELSQGQYSSNIITDFELGDRLDVSAVTSFGALDANQDGLVDQAFLTQQGGGLLLDLSAAGGGKVQIDNVTALASRDFV